MDAKSIRHSTYLNIAPIKNQSRITLFDLDESSDDESSDDRNEIPQDATARNVFAAKCLDEGKYATLEAIAKQYGSLAVLEMTDNRWRRLCELLRNQLRVQSLDIGGINLEERDMGQLNFLADNSIVSSLDISRNRLSVERIQTFSEIFRRNRGLTSLNLSGNDIPFAGINALMNASKERNTLMRLILERINISAGKRSRAEELAKGLKNNHSITALSLENNEINDINAEIIAKSLKENRALKYLNLRRNKITTAGVHAFIKVIENNRTLMSIHFSHNTEINAGTLNDLKGLLKANELNNDRFHQYRRVVIFVNRYVINQFKRELPFELTEKIASHLDTGTYERINQWVKV